MADDLLIETLRFAVPLWIVKVRAWTAAERIRRAGTCAHIIASHGDALQFPEKNTTAMAFNALAEGLAIAALQPGGVTYGDQHWEADPGNLPAATPGAARTGGGVALDPAAVERIVQAARTDPARPDQVDLDDGWCLVEITTDHPGTGSRPALQAGDLVLVPPDTAGSDEPHAVYSDRMGWTTAGPLPVRDVLITEQPPHPTGR
jgi:hypothetical protein